MRIVIPTNDETCLRACVDSIVRNEPFIHQEDDIMAVLDGVRVGAVYSNSVSVHGCNPFCFSRNINRGISALTELGDRYVGGVVLLNHDALLETPGGFSAMTAWADQHPEYGIVSSAVRGACCNPAQEYTGFAPRVEVTDATVAFVCVYIPHRTLDTIGLLDERFTGYGYEDDLYCTQVRAAGLKVGVYHGCAVEHGSLPSSFRTQPDCGEKMKYNHKLYHQIVAEKGLEKFSMHHSWCGETFA